MRITGVATGGHKYEQCQMPITIDENLRFVVQFDDIDDLTCGVRHSHRNDRRRYQCGHVHTLHPPAVGTLNSDSSSSSPSPTRQKMINSTQQNLFSRHSPKLNNQDNLDYPRKTFKEDIKQHFTDHDLRYVGTAAKSDLNSVMKRYVPCINCRKSVEVMFDIVTKKGHTISNSPLPKSPTDSAVSSSSVEGCGSVEVPLQYPQRIFSGLSFNRSHEITLEEDILYSNDNFNALYNFLFVFGARHAVQIEAMKTKKTNNRCMLHSLDSRGGLDLKNKRLRNKQNGDMAGLDNDNQFVPGTNASYLNDSGVGKNTVGNVGYFGMSSIATREELKDTWWNVWRMLTLHCKKEICCLDSKQLLDVVHSYLERHSFCVDCRSQILKAYYKLCPKAADAYDRALANFTHNEPPENENLYQSSQGTDSAGEGSQDSERHLAYDEPAEIDVNCSDESSIQLLDESDEYIPAEKTRVLSNSAGQLVAPETITLQKLTALKVNLAASTLGMPQPCLDSRIRLNEQTGQFESLSDGDTPDVNRMTANDRQLRELVERGKSEIEMKRSGAMKERSRRPNRRRESSVDGDADNARSQTSNSTTEDSEIINQFDPLVFRGLRYCVHENGGRTHVHVTTHDDDIRMLLTRAENEIIHQFGSNAHARHAKTMVQAQHEILVCIGIFIYERLHRVWYAWQSCTQTAPLLASLTLEAMRNKFDEILEEKQGGPMEKYEKLCLELDLVDREKELKAEKKREKKKRQKAKKNELKLKKQEQAAQAQEKLQKQQTAHKLGSPTSTDVLAYEPIQLQSKTHCQPPGFPSELTDSKNSMDNVLHSSSGSSIGLGKSDDNYDHSSRNELKINATSNGFDTSSEDNDGEGDGGSADDEMLKEMRAFRERTTIDKGRIRRTLLARFEACTIKP